MLGFERWLHRRVRGGYASWVTPRQAEVAFVLEGVPGVRAVYAVEGGKLAENCEFAVEVDSIGALTAAHYALLRVLTNEECTRVRLYLTDMPSGLGRATKRLSLDPQARNAARDRVPPPHPLARLELLWRHILVVDGDAATATFARQTFGTKYPCHWVTSVAHGASFATSTLPWCLLLVDSGLALGADGLLARLPLELKPLIFVVADASDLSYATSCLGGTERILTRPLSPSQLWRAFDRATTSLSTPELPHPREQVARRITLPAPGAPHRVLLVGVEGDFDLALGRVLGGEIEFIVKRNVEEAIEYVFAHPVSLVFCGDDRFFIDGVAREDAAAARKIIVAVNARDLFRVRDVLALRSHQNPVIALPLEDESLRAAVLDSHPELALPTRDASTKVVRPPYRRIAALVVDDDASTQILFSAGMSIDDTDVALETTALAAFEHVLSRPVDVLFVSTSLRTDTGEPFYRSLWRMKPELKARTVLITAPDAAPPSARDTKLPRILERPFSRPRLAEIVAAFRRATP